VTACKLHIACETAIRRYPHNSSEISALPDSTVKNTPSVKKLCPQKIIASACNFVKT
jgi:hypothetical protein